MSKLSFESGCLAKKIFQSFDRNQPAKRIVDRSNLLRPLALEKLQWFRTDSGTSYRLSKSEAPLSSRKAHPQPKKYAKGGKECQQRIDDIHRRHRGPLPASGVIGCAKTVTRDVNPTAS